MSGSSKKLLHAAAGTLAASGDPIYVDDVFSTFLFNGTGASNAIDNGIDLSGEGGLVWGKRRNLGNSHWLIDTVNGIDSRLECDGTGAATDKSSSFTAFNDNGFTVATTDNEFNNANGTYTSWTFRKAEKFFDIVTYTGNATARTIAHNLGSTPGMIIVKRLNGAKNWAVYHTSMGANYWDILNVGQEKQVNTNLWNNTAPTDSVFSVGTDGHNNGNNDTYVAYLFASDAGGYGDDGDENIIKCGVYTTDGQGDATVNLGFEPQWIFSHRTNGDVPWYIRDVMRGMPVVTNNALLSPNLADAESSSSDVIWPTTTGFTVYNDGASKVNIYVAIRRPNKPPTAATEVFLSSFGDAGSDIDVGFPLDLLILGTTDSTGSSATHVFVDRLRGSKKYLQTNTMSVEQSANGEFTLTVRTIAHNLGVKPDLMFFKNRTTNNIYWVVYNSASGAEKYHFLHQDSAIGDSIDHFNDTEPTASVFTLGDGNYANRNNDEATAYLFGSLDGVSKIGSIVHSGTTDVACGFEGGARFVIAKRLDDSGGWYVWDTTRGIIAGNDPYVLFDTTDAEVTNTDYIDPLTGGFTFSDNFTDGTYLYFAIA